MFLYHLHKVFSNLDASGLGLKSFKLIFVGVFRVVVELLIGITVHSDTEGLFHCPTAKLLSSGFSEVRLLRFVFNNHFSRVFLISLLHSAASSLRLAYS
jgi:hypothetical protein